MTHDNVTAVYVFDGSGVADFILAGIYTFKADADRWIERAKIDNPKAVIVGMQVTMEKAIDEAARSRLQVLGLQIERVPEVIVEIA